jgi:hypothetical protein
MFEIWTNKLEYSLNLNVNNIHYYIIWSKFFENEEDKSNSYQIAVNFRPKLAEQSAKRLS